jgi:hypothetical protein
VSKKCTTITALLVSIALLVSMLRIASSTFGQEVVTGSLSGVSLSAGVGWILDATASGNDGTADTLVFISVSFVVSGGTQDVNRVLTGLPAESQSTDIEGSPTYALRGV